MKEYKITQNETGSENNGVRYVYAAVYIIYTEHDGDKKSFGAKIARKCRLDDNEFCYIRL